MTIVDDIKSKIDVVDLVGEYVQLRRAGKNWSGSCPFHGEKTASFTVFPGSQRWKCFGAGCGRSGDIFEFVQQKEGWDFSEALKYLAHKAGVELKPQTKEDQKRDELKRDREAVFAMAMGFFVDRLCAGGRGKEYAAGRGWADEAITDSGVGYFGRDWQALRAHLKAAGADLESPAAVALLGYQGDVQGWARVHGVQAAGGWITDGKIPGMPPDMLIYPHIRRGRVEYLAGRRLPDPENPNLPKSWNPPLELAGARAPFFNHAWWKRAASDERAPVVILEGQGDGVTLAGWGIAAACLVGCDLDTDSALLGEIKRKAKEGAQVVLGLDSDTPGQKATRKLADLLQKAGLSAIQFGRVIWPEKDPNDWLKDGATESDARALLDRSPTWLDVLVSAAQPDRDDVVDPDAERDVFAALVGLDGYEIERRREGVCDALGIRKRMFDGLLKAARKDAGQGDDGQAKYFVEAGRIFSRFTDSQGNEVIDALCNFQAEIVDDVLRDNGLEVVREFRITGKNGKWGLPPARVRAEDFQKMDWVLSSWGSRAIIEAGSRRKDQLRAAIQHLSKETQRRVIYTHTGWREADGKRVYLTATGAVGAEGVEVELDQDLDLYSIPLSADDPAGAMRESLRFLDVAPERVSYPLWGAMFLAPLCELVNVAFTMWVFGPTGTMKSTYTALAMNHYGAGFDDKHLPAGFTDTANRLEQKTFMVKDAPLVIDDFAPQKDQRSYSEYTRAAHRIVRDVGNQTGRGRLNADSTAKVTYSPRGLVIITGEDVPESESIMARLFVVEFYKLDVDKARLSERQAARERLSHAMSGYLSWLAENWSGFESTLPARWREYRQKAFSDGLHLRLPEAVAGLMLGIEMGLRYALHLGVINDLDFQALMEIGWNSLGEGAKAMVSRVQDEKPEELFARAFRELLTQGKIYLRYRESDGKLLGGQDADRAEMLGWYDADYFYLLPDATFNRIAEQFRKAGNVFPVREQTLRKMLLEAGILEKRNDRMTPGVWLEGKPQRVLVLRRVKIETGEE
jgi:DNA primase